MNEYHLSIYCGCIYFQGFQISWIMKIMFFYRVCIHGTCIYIPLRFVSHWTCWIFNLVVPLYPRNQWKLVANKYFKNPHDTVFNLNQVVNFFYSSFEVTAVVKKKEKENKFRYTVKKLPGDIVPEKCKTEVIIKIQLN